MIDRVKRSSKHVALGAAVGLALALVVSMFTTSPPSSTPRAFTGGGGFVPSTKNGGPISVTGGGVLSGNGTSGSPLTATLSTSSPVSGTGSAGSPLTAVISTSGDAITGTGSSGSPLIVRVSTVDSETGGVWAPPSSPHAYDDEFILTSLDGDWSTASGAAVTFATAIDPYAAFSTGDARASLTRRAGWLMVQPNGNGTLATSEVDFAKTVSLATNCLIIARFSFNNRNSSSANNDANVGIHLMAAADLPRSTSTNYLSLFLNENDTATTQAEFLKNVSGSVTSVGVTVNKGGAGGAATDHTSYEAIAIQKIGTTFHGWAFTGNASATHLGSTTYAGTIDRLVFTVNNGATASPGNSIVGIDFIRVIDSATYLP